MGFVVRRNIRSIHVPGWLIAFRRLLSRRPCHRRCKGDEAGHHSERREANMYRLARGSLTMRRVLLWGGGIVLVVLTFVLLLRRQEPRWTLVLESSATDAAPWQPIHVSARVEPASALGRARSQWRWYWESDADRFSENGPEIDWRSGTAG